MIRAVPLPVPVLVRSQQPVRPSITRAELLWLGVALALTIATVLFATFVGPMAAPPGVQVVLTDSTPTLPLDSSIAVRLDGWGARLEGATLVETRVGPDGQRRDDAVALDPRVVRSGWLPGQTEVALRPASGSLRPDAEYRLVVRSSALRAALPLPGRGPAQQAVTFSTPTSPRPQAADAPVRLGWGAPFPIRWNMPLASIRAEVSPPVPARSWIDPSDRRLAYVMIEDAQEAATYQVTVVTAVGANGIALQQPATYTLVAPSRPKLVGSGEPITAEVGRPVTLQFDQPVESVRLEVAPPLSATWRVSPRDPTNVKVQIEGLAQGEQYELTVAEATARGGAPLVEPATVSLTTPPPLTVAEFLPGSAWVPLTVKPTVVFGEPVRDRAAAEAAVKLDPPLPGSFNWLDDTRLQFVPRTALPYDTRLTLRVAPGPDGARSAGGGYLEAAETYAFQTAPNKTIDVDVTRQMMTLIEGGRTVRTFLVGTGIPGADTPIGEFRVQYKMPTARFRGYNAAAGYSYDLPNVKWVLAFMGDYTIHGAYWRQTFGTPSSNGCVGLTDADAKIVYDWAPEGTLIRIHY